MSLVVHLYLINESSILTPVNTRDNDQRTIVIDNTHSHKHMHTHVADNNSHDKINGCTKKPIQNYIDRENIKT